MQVLTGAAKTFGAREADFGAETPEQLWTEPQSLIADGLFQKRFGFG
jgi:hypothetical protein